MSVTRTTSVLLAALAAVILASPDFGELSRAAGGFAADKAKATNKSAGRIKVANAKPAAKVKSEGYKPLKPGTVRIWDTNRKYTHFYVGFVAWKDRAMWTQVPYGKTGHKFKGEAVMENDNMFLFLHSGKQSGPILYAKLGKGKHSIHNALYRVWWEDGGKVHHYDTPPRENRIEKNNAGEAVIVNLAAGHNFTKSNKLYGKMINAGRYRILGGRHWLEVTPVKGKKADEMGYHGEARVMLVPDYKNGNDYVFDSTENRYATYGRHGSPDEPVLPSRRADTVRAATDRPGWGSYPMTPPGSKMLIDLQMSGGQFMWTMTYPSWKVAKPYINWCVGGRLDRWPPWRGRRDRGGNVWSAPYGCFGNQKIVVGVLNSPGSWHPEVVGTPLKGGFVDGKPVQAGEKYTCKWKARYAGKWRMTARFRDDKAPGKGRYYSQQATMDKGGKFVFTCPAAGKLEYIILYLYDRTDKTPPEVGTPMDVYRETITGKKVKSTAPADKVKGGRATGLKAGVATVRITPPVGVITNGGKKTTGVAGELFAKALVLNDGKTTAALITADVILLGKKIVAETRERIEKTTGIPGSHVMFAASHTHCSPVTMRQAWGTGAKMVPDQSYLDKLVTKMAGAVSEANSRLVEVRVGVGEGRAPYNINRWIPTPKGRLAFRWGPYPAGPTDETLSVLRLDRTDGTPLAAVVNFAAHPTVMSWGRQFCGDFPGFLQETLEKVYDGKMTVMFINGAAGDLKIKWLWKRRRGSLGFAYGGAKDARRWGRIIAGVALTVLEQVKTNNQPLRISISSKQVEFPMVPLPSAEDVQKQLAAKRKAGRNTTWEERILPSLRDGTAPKTIAGEVQLLRLGDDIALLAVPGELFVEVGLRMKKELGCKHLFIVGFANGYVGYLPSARFAQLEGNRKVYEWYKFFWYPAGFSEGVEPALMSAAKELTGVK